MRPTTSIKRFQENVFTWIKSAFGEKLAYDRRQRNHRFLEESLELVQSTGCAREDAHLLVDYVFDREVGEPAQEAGGVFLTLCGLCEANQIDLQSAAAAELDRAWAKIAIIRQKQADKPYGTPVPQQAAYLSPKDSKLLSAMVRYAQTLGADDANVAMNAIGHLRSLMIAANGGQDVDV